MEGHRSADAADSVGLSKVWYVEGILAIQAPFRIVRPGELRDAAALLKRRLLQAGSPV